MITARLALEQGRELFAVPGSPLDPRARGTNRLIRDGAMLIETADDVLEALAPAREFAPVTPRISARDSMLGEPGPAAEAGDAARATVRDLLGPGPVAIDDLIRESQLTPGTVATILLELELAGSLERLPGSQVSIVKTGV